MVQAAIGIGSNVGAPSKNVENAIVKLAQVGDLIARSSLYQTKPWGVLNQADFINAAAIIEVDYSPREFLNKLLSIELSMGRERKDTERWGPRVIDLDILTYGDSFIDEPDLRIPHRHMLERAFVLAPLAEIDKSYLAYLYKLPREAQEEVVRLQSPASE